MWGRGYGALLGSKAGTISRYGGLVGLRDASEVGPRMAKVLASAREACREAIRRATDVLEPRVVGESPLAGQRSGFNLCL